MVALCLKNQKVLYTLLVLRLRLYKLQAAYDGIFGGP